MTTKYGFVDTQFRQLANRLALLGFLVSAGCQSPHLVEVDDSGNPQIQTARVRYEVRPSFLPTPTAPVQQVSLSTYDRLNQQDWHWSAARLSILYPADESRPDTALATLRLIQSTSGPSPKHSRVLKQLEIPRGQLDLLLYDLAHAGYFENQDRLFGEAYLRVNVDAGSEAKSWTSEPRLNDIVDRVYREGTTQ